MTHIGDQLLHVPQRENSGEDSDAAFAFQKDWALSELLDRQLMGHDYLYILEYHDDVLFLDSEIPKTIEFIQIKKSDRATWTINRLTKPPKESTNSIIGKLFLHLSNFKSEHITLRFVSDMFFNFSTEKRFTANTIKEDDQKLICDQIEKEIPNLRPIQLDKLTFEQCKLSFEMHSDQLMGQIVRFIEAIFGKNTKVRPSTLYDTLQRKAERSRNRSDRTSNFQELILRKGIGKSEIDKLISDLRTSEDSVVEWDDLRDYVDQLSTTKRERLFFKGCFRKIDADRKINSSEVLKQAFDEAQAALSVSGIDDNATTIYRTVETHLVEKKPDIAKCFSEKEIAMIAVMVYCEMIICNNEVP